LAVAWQWVLCLSRGAACFLPLVGQGYRISNLLCAPWSIFSVLRAVSTSRPCERSDP
jgi:hypothetical protein